jgi:ribosomal protein L1
MGEKMKTYQTTVGEIMSMSEALDVLYDLRDVLMEQQDETLDGAVILPDSVEVKKTVNALSSVIYWERRRKKGKSVQ